MALAGSHGHFYHSGLQSCYGLRPAQNAYLTGGHHRFHDALLGAIARVVATGSTNHSSPVARAYLRPGRAVDSSRTNGIGRRHPGTGRPSNHARSGALLGPRHGTNQEARHLGEPCGSDNWLAISDLRPSHDRDDDSLGVTSATDRLAGEHLAGPGLSPAIFHYPGPDAVVHERESAKRSSGHHLDPGYSNRWCLQRHTVTGRTSERQSLYCPAANASSRGDCHAQKKVSLRPPSPAPPLQTLPLLVLAFKPLQLSNDGSQV